MSEQTPEDGQPSPGSPPPMPPPAAPPAAPAYPTYPAQPAYQQPPYAQQPSSQPAYGYPHAYGYPQPSGVVEQRPGTLTAAYVVTWVLLALTTVGLVVVLAFALGNDNAFYDAIRDTGESTDDIRTAMIVGCVVLLVWTGLALLFSVFGFHRHGWGRIALTISAAISVPVQFLAAAAVIPIISALATIGVIVLLYVGDANAWYRSRNDGGLPPAPPGVTFYR